LHPPACLACLAFLASFFNPQSEIRNPQFHHSSSPFTYLQQDHPPLFERQTGVTNTCVHLHQSFVTSLGHLLSFVDLDEFLLFDHLHNPFQRNEHN
jgi:hypothetical protein